VPQDDPPPIEFDGVTKRFGRHTILDGPGFTVPQGSVVGLPGPNDLT
jgi:ABC-2 type transport system ATP-binding protein